MAADGNSIKTDIDAGLADKGYRGVRIAMVITILKKVVDWVTTSINGNLSTWYKIGTTTPSTTNADNVYRTGKVVVGSSTETGGTDVFTVMGTARTRNGLTSHTNTNSTASMAATPAGASSGLQIISNVAAGPAFMEFHVQGLRIDQMGVDTDGRFVFRPWSTSSTYEFVLNGYNATVRANNAIQNRKIIVYDENNNDHQYMGFGVNAGLMRYQVAVTTNDHVFFAGSSPATSVELMRIKGNGSVGIGIGPNPKNGLEIGRGWFSHVANNGGVTPGSGQGISLGWNYSAGSGESNLVWGTGTIPTAWLGFSTFDGTTMTERMRLSAAGDLQVNGEVIAGSAAANKNVTAYGVFKSYFGSVLRAFRLGGATTTSGLTLKTTQYVSLEIDGTVYKLALVN